MVVAGASALFATPGVNIGVFCSTPMVAISRAVPAKQAMEMLLIGEMVDASNAVSIGLVNRVVPDDQLSLAIGRRGQNVRLASQLTGWDIDILTEAEESERRQKEFVERSTLFMEALDVDELVGQVLAP